MHSEYKDLADEEVFALSLEKPDVFEVIVRRYEDAFLRKARSIVRDEEAVKDIVQDTFVKIYLYGKKWKPMSGAKWGSWVYKILINTCFSKYGKMRRDKEMTVVYSDEMESLMKDGSAEGQAESTDNTRYLHSLIDRLPETFARVLRLYAVGGKKYAEIAEAEGITVGAVKTRMHRAKLALKKLNAEITY